MRVTPLNWPRKPTKPTKICFGGWAEGDGAGVLGGECIEEPGNEDPGAGGALGGVEELAEKTLELPGIFYLEGVDRHGDYGGGALTLIRGCIQAELGHEVQEVLVVGEG